MSYNNNSHCVSEAQGEQGTMEMGLKLTYLMETKSLLYRLSSFQPDGGGLFPLTAAPTATLGRNAAWLQTATLSVTINRAKVGLGALPLELSKKNGGESRACCSPDNSVFS